MNFIIIAFIISTFSQSREYSKFFRNKGIAEYHFSVNNWKKAIPYFKKALNVEPNNTNILVNLAECNLNIGDTLKTFYYLEKGCNNGAQIKYIKKSETFKNSQIIAYKRWKQLAMKDSVWHNIYKSKMRKLNDSLATVINKMIMKDQMLRKSGYYVADSNKTDNENLDKLQKIIKKYGWPGRKLIGNDDAIILLFHTPISVRVQYFDLLLEEIYKGNLSPSAYAAFVDDCLLESGKKQRYGMALVKKESGKKVIAPVKNIENIDKRREKIGLIPFNMYCKKRNIIQ